MTSPTNFNLVSQPVGSWQFRAPGIVLLAVSYIFLFAQLGHYSLWDDEALTALVSVGITMTGDTSIKLNHNVVAYRNGLLVKDGKDRATPPLCEYLPSLFLNFFPGSVLAARVPFALLGWLTVLLGVVILWKNRVSPLVQWLFCAAVLGNISFFLYFRQCRYYGLVIFLSALIVALYLSSSISRKRLFLIAVLSVLLFASNYLSMMVLYACLAADYLLWRRKEIALEMREWATLLVPQAVGCLLIALVWNPLNTSYGSYLQKNTLWDRLTMFWWGWRDMNQCEFFSGLLLTATLIGGIIWKDRWLIRGFFAGLLYTIALAAISPQVRQMTSVADVRYFVPLIPLFIAVQVRFLSRLANHSKILVVVIAVVAFGTNLLNGGPMLTRGFHSTVVDYLGELFDPPAEPYAPTIQWVKDHVKPGQSIAVYPDYMMYSLMFHAPHAVYAWQLTDPPPPSLSDLPPIHFHGKEAPDFLIGFGPSTGQLIKDVNALGGSVQYQLAEQLDYLGTPLYRPELFWRTFKSVLQFDRQSQAIYIFLRVSPPIKEN